MKEIQIMANDNLNGPANTVRNIIQYSEIPGYKSLGYPKLGMQADM
jgi:hypothetical protein